MLGSDMRRSTKAASYEPPTGLNTNTSDSPTIKRAKKPMRENLLQALDQDDRERLMKMAVGNQKLLRLSTRR